MCDRARPLGQEPEPTAGGESGEKTATGRTVPQGGRLYVKLPSADDPRMRKLRLVLNMFPGNSQVVLYCEDTQKRLGAAAELHPALIAELRELFGVENVVVK